MTAPTGRADDILASLAGRGIRPGTAAVRRVLAAMGDPHERTPAVLIAGTNGKGSTAALITSVARAAGYRTGCFTSPALVSAVEQVTIDGRPIDDATLARALREVIGHGERILPGRLTAFEALTAAAFLLFAEHAVDLTILEAGLGGRDDATNIVHATVAVLTTVAGDHAAWLGKDPAEIARVKSGIFRADRPAVVGWLELRALDAARDAAHAIGARLTIAPTAIDRFEIDGRGLDPQRLRFATGRAAYDLELPLLGAHQAHNMALAALAAEQLADEGFPAIDATAIARGAAASRWPGRLEPFVLPDGTDVLVDGAHNASGAWSLARFLDRLDRPVALVFAAYGDKEVDRMLDALSGVGERGGSVRLYLAPLDRSRSWDLDRHARGPLRVAASRHPGVALALDAALADSRTVPDSLLVACGSLRTVALAHAWLAEHGARPRG